MKVEVTVLAVLNNKHRFLDSLAFKLRDLSASEQESVDLYMGFIYLPSYQLLVTLLLFHMNTIQVSSVQGLSLIHI